MQGNGIRVAKLGWVTMTEPLRFDGKMMRARISEREETMPVRIYGQLPEPERQIPERVIAGIGYRVSGIGYRVSGIGYLSPEWNSLTYREYRDTC
ncbi:MAG: hypothetical protein HC837_21525 [Chloroflexaceae bacterium]|nr:hypothetical protein [Chloroflexaceae bacterium]